jgi:hypothetical protein
MVTVVAAAEVLVAPPALVRATFTVPAFAPVASCAGGGVKNAMLAALESVMLNGSEVVLANTVPLMQVELVTHTVRASSDCGVEKNGARLSRPLAVIATLE